MAAPLGNQFAARNRVLEQRIKRLIAEDDYKRFDHAIRTQLGKAAKGDLGALQFLVERVDGKVRADDAGGDDVRSIPLSQLMQAILQARAATAVDAVPRGTECVEQVVAIEASTHSDSAADKAEHPAGEGDIPVGPVAGDE